MQKKFQYDESLQIHDDTLAFEIDSKLNHLDGTYQVLLEAWVDHLEYGSDIYRNYSISDKLDESLQAKGLELFERVVSEYNR